MYVDEFLFLDRRVLRQCYRFSEVCFINRAILHNQAVIRACLKEKQNIHFVTFLNIFSKLINTISINFRKNKECHIQGTKQQHSTYAKRVIFCQKKIYKYKGGKCETRLGHTFR